MMRHRTGAPLAEEDPGSSSDDEDAFSAFSSRKRKKQKQATESANATKSGAEIRLSDTKLAAAAEASKPMPDSILPVSNTSSTKRHHGAASDTRQARMDAILQELEAEKDLVQTELSSSRGGGSRSGRKKGSFVDDGDEHITTNVFVGNLAPSITEEQMTELFRQFGENDTAISAMGMALMAGCLCSDFYSGRFCAGSIITLTFSPSDEIRSYRRPLFG